MMEPRPPASLKCEYLVNPAGMDVRRPRFAWVVAGPERGTRQSAFQIIVSSEEDLCRNEIGDFWDSGPVESENSWGAVYQGEPFLSCHRYYWRVRWWDGRGRMSPFSETAFFDTGFIHEEDWKAKWIGMKSPKEFRSGLNLRPGEPGGEYIQTHAVYLRREFLVREPVARAVAYICGLGCYELYVNGQKTGDRVLDPAWTDYRKTGMYSAFDVAPFLRSRSALGVILGSGRHLRNYGYDQPKMICRLELEYESGAREIVLSDENWKVSHGPLQENGLYFGERYDARLEVAGWCEPGLDDSSWEKASVFSGPPLTAQMVPPCRVERRLKTVRLSNPDPGVYIYDFGQNFTGWVRLHVTGPRGTEIRLRHSELLFEDGRLNTGPNGCAEATDVYILKGEGVESYEPRFTYHGFRYVEVCGFPGEPAVESLEGAFVHTDVERTGEFGCSNELINRIHQNVQWGQLSNLMSIPTDCPQRDERHGWLGDAHLAAEEAIHNFDMAAFYTEFLDDIRLAQKEDGSLPDTVPPYLQTLYPADPAWGAAYGILIGLMYHYYGDSRIVEKHYAPFRRYVEFLGRNAENHIQKKLGKYGDWCPPGSIFPKKTPVELTSTWYYYGDVLCASRMAAILGRDEEARSFSRLAADVRSAFNAAFLKEDQYAAVRMSPIDNYASQTSNVLPLFNDLVPPENKAKVLDKLLESVVRIQDHHLDTGILGTRYLLDVLSENGHDETALKVVLQKTYPGWGYMIEEGATTLWERWENLTGIAMNSQNHIMLGSVDAWFYRYLAGVRCLEPGWKKILFKPPASGALTSARARLKTVRGVVAVEWDKGDSLLALRLSVPAGAEARVALPLLWKQPVIAESGRVLWENGGPRENAPGVSSGRTDGPSLEFEVVSGEYQFEIRKAG